MIPNDYKIPMPEKKEYELLPEDTYQVQITSLELLEDVELYQSTEREDKFKFEFTIVEEGQYKGRKLWLEARTVLSPGSNGFSASWLYKLFCAVNGTNLGEEETKSVTASNINEMENKQLRLVVKQKANTKGVTKNKITDVMALKGEEIDYTPTPTADDISVEDIPF